MHREQVIDADPFSVKDIPTLELSALYLKLKLHLDTDVTLMQKLPSKGSFQKICGNTKTPRGRVE
jgi:hypothetical protein